VREIYEESGLETKAQKLLAVYDRSKHPHKPLMPFHIYKLFFLCKITGGSKQTSHETTAVDFFDEDQIPELSVSRVLPYQITRMFEHYRNPDMSTDFD
jgi:ADP-ribose pyrophosphatase YjhB (NUDIX family)